MPDLSSYQLDPSILPTIERVDGELPPPPYVSSAMIVDATLKCDGPEIALPPSDFMEKTRTRWHEYGLPALPRRDRLERLAEHHGADGVWFTLPQEA